MPTHYIGLVPGARQAVPYVRLSASREEFAVSSASLGRHPSTQRHKRTYRDADGGSATTGLGSFQVLLPNADEVEDVALRLATTGHDVDRTGRTCLWTTPGATP